jgi:hypothetical protein
VVEVELISFAERDRDETNDSRSHFEIFKSVIGKATNLPQDAAYQHDHYLYGTPKKP